MTESAHKSHHTTIGNYTVLDDAKIVRTAQRLTRRVAERFPESGLAAVSCSVHQTACESEARIARLRRPNWPLRSGVGGVLFFCGVVAVYLLFGGISWREFSDVSLYSDVVGLLEATMGTVVFFIAFVLFLLGLENRIKQRQVLKALNELRSLAHVVDMHQLTKDPERYLVPGPNTESSPTRNLTLFELGRYLDYCAELLSILSKISALWAQAFPETNVLAAVDQVENLATGLSRKIWQKVTLLERIQGRDPSDWKLDSPKVEQADAADEVERETR